jgi:DEAD/DEAH box helicase domain-containing protein
VAVATPTASGKSLIYLLPVLEQFLRDPESRALFLFPLKALAQDQLRVIEELLSPLPPRPGPGRPSSTATPRRISGASCAKIRPTSF